MKQATLKFILFLAVTCTFLYACEPRKIVKPTDLIARQEFVDLLADVRILEGSYSAKVSRPDSIAN